MVDPTFPFSRFRIVWCHIRNGGYALLEVSVDGLTCGCADVCLHLCVCVCVQENTHSFQAREAFAQLQEFTTGLGKLSAEAFGISSIDGDSAAVAVPIGVRLGLDRCGSERGGRCGTHRIVAGAAGFGVVAEGSLTLGAILVGSDDKVLEGEVRCNIFIGIIASGATTNKVWRGDAVFVPSVLDLTAR